MRITFHGAARTVTGSRHLVEACGKRILLDCGLFQGRRKESFEENRRALPGGPPDMVILSHAHMDHAGNLPSLLRQGFQGEIWATGATRDLCSLMLQDSAHIQVGDVAFVNKRRRREGRAPFEALYTPEEARQVMEQVNGLSYGRWRDIAPGLRLRFTDAGHMLGSAHVWLEVCENGSAPKTLLFSGDIGRRDIPIIRDPQPPLEGADILIMESTYAGRSHPPYAVSEAELEAIVLQAHREKGVVLIPAFAVGRTQQLVVALHRLHDRGAIPGMPVYVDSPLATDITSVFRLHPETYDEETLESLHRAGNPFSFRALRYTRSVEESRRLNNVKGPAIIISGSGMLEHGRIRHHVRNRVHDPHTILLITGWQAPHTLGRQLADGAREVSIHGEWMPVRCQVRELQGFSGHADQAELEEWVGAMGRRPSRAYVVHGEEEGARAFCECLKVDHGFAHADAPFMGQVEDL